MIKISFLSYLSYFRQSFFHCNEHYFSAGSKFPVETETEVWKFQLQRKNETQQIVRTFLQKDDSFPTTAVLPV